LLIDSLENVSEAKLSYIVSIDTIERKDSTLSQQYPPSDELEIIKKGFSSETKTVNIRLREGEYQFDLAKAIASCQLELRCPDVKDLIKKLYGETKTEDIQFIRKIQTILKKMEKSGIITILPKKKPWELQRYALSSFKFQDIEKNLIVLATESEVKKTLEIVRSPPSIEHIRKIKPNHRTAKISLLIVVIIVSYATILWTLTQPATNPIIFVLAFSIAAVCSILLGMSITRRK